MYFTTIKKKCRFLGLTKGLLNQEEKKQRDEKPLKGFEQTDMIVGHLESICENTILGVLQLPEEQKMSNKSGKEINQSGQ